MNALKEIFYFIWKKIVERKSRKHYRMHYKDALEKFKCNENKKPKQQMKREQKILQKFWGCYPFQYIRYEMYTKDCPLSIEEMKAYIPNFFAYYLFFPTYFKQYRVLTDDKRLTSALFAAYHIRQPELLFTYTHGQFLDRANKSLAADAVNLLIQEATCQKIFVKPTFGIGGKGIIVFHLKEETYRNHQNEILTAKWMRHTLTNASYIVQKGLTQHEELNKIYPHAINTFRILTKVEHGRVSILYALLRMGKGGKEVDNASQNGVICSIDKNTGCFDAVAFTGLRERIKVHPDSGFIFENYQFPYWEEVTNFIMEVAEKVYQIKYLGWDLAFTTDGPAVIEINAGAGIEFLQDCYGGVRSGYEINNPRFWWRQSQFFIQNA
jgi:hypothetical protein